jgi:hypothetical protein
MRQSQNIFPMPHVTHAYVNHQTYLHTEQRKIRGRSPDKHLPPESALFPYVRWRGFANVVNDHQPRGSVLAGSPAEEMAHIFFWAPVVSIFVPWKYVFKNYLRV